MWFYVKFGLCQAVCKQESFVLCMQASVCCDALSFHLQAKATVSCEQEFSLDQLLLDIVEQLRVALADASAEAAHLKAIGLWEGVYGVANLVSSDTPAQLSLPANCKTKIADVVINARVATAPDVLEKLVQNSVRAVCDTVGANAKFRQTRSFRPGRPVPTHRFT